MHEVCDITDAAPDVLENKENEIIMYTCTASRSDLFHTSLYHTIPLTAWFVFTSTTSCMQLCTHVYCWRRPTLIMVVHVTHGNA